MDALITTTSSKYYNVMLFPGIYYQRVSQRRCSCFISRNISACIPTHVHFWLFLAVPNNRKACTIVFKTLWNLTLCNFVMSNKICYPMVSWNKCYFGRVLDISRSCALGVFDSWSISCDLYTSSWLVNLIVNSKSHHDIGLHRYRMARSKGLSGISIY